MTKVQLKRWGNSQGVRIPKEILDVLNLPNDVEFILEIDRNEKVIHLQADEGLTPYQKLIKHNRKEDELEFSWDRIESELI